VQVLLEPPCSELSYVFGVLLFLKEMRGPRDDLSAFGQRSWT